MANHRSSPKKPCFCGDKDGSCLFQDDGVILCYHGLEHKDDPPEGYRFVKEAREEMGAVFAPDNQGSIQSQSQKAQEYVYHNADGQPYQLVKRYYKNGKKQFAQYHWDGRGWKPGLPQGFKRVPYRLPEILKSQRIAIVEGEKDCETARASGLEATLGVVFTTNPQGAGKWPKGCGQQYLTGKEVVIFPDNDSPGFSHAQHVYQDLQPFVRLLAIIQLPNVPAKGDLTDCLQGSGSVRTVEELIQQALEQPEQFGPEHLPPISETQDSPSSQLSNSESTNRSKLAEWHRPLIRLDPGRLNGILFDLEAALSPSNAPRDAIYVQGSHEGFYLSRVLKATLDNRSHLIETSKDIDTLDLVTPESLQYELNRRFRFERYDARKEGYKPVDCPRTVASQFLQKGRWPQLPRLTGISYIPLLCKDGTVINQPGYHEPTGILLQFNPDEFPAIPEILTKEDAIAALNILIDWLKEFPFQAEKHRSAAISAVLTAVCRKVLKQAPLHATSATKAGSGKGTLAKGVSILLLDGQAGTIPFTGDSEEFRKKITSFLKSGQPIGLIDNVTGVLGGDVLEMVLTEPYYKDRLLGGNQIPSFSTQTLLLANGNNLRFRPDMTRRTILSVLDSQLENPEYRVFDRNFEEFTHANRGKLVAAALTILKTYIVAGSPDKKQPRLGSFEGWSDLVRSSLIWLGQPDPVETQAEITAQDDERQTLLALLQSWYDCYTSIPKTAKEVCLGAIQTGSGDLRDVLLEVALDRKGDISPRKLGYYLRSHCRSVISGLRFETAGEDRLGTTRWKVTVLHPPPEPSPASPAQTAGTTQNQAVDCAGDKFSSAAFARNGKGEDTTVQEIGFSSPVPSNNRKSRACDTFAGDAGDSSSRPSETVSSKAGVRQADLSNGCITPPVFPDTSITVGSTVSKGHKRGWVGKVDKVNGNTAEVFWSGDTHPTKIPLSELRLKEAPL